MKKGYMKNVFKTLFSICLVFQCGIPALAENNTDGPEASDPTDAKETIPSEEQNLNPATYLSDTNDQLLQEYLDNKIRKHQASGRTIRFSRRRGTNLTGLNLEIYNQLKNKIDQIVNGKIVGTDFQFETHSSKSTFTAEELGIKAGQLKNSGDVYKALNQKYPGLYLLDGNAVFEALLADEPYELYWLDKTSSTAVSWSNPSYTYYSDGTLDLNNELSFRMTVNLEYRQNENDPYTISSSKVSSVNQAIKNADSILQEAAGKSDYDKLLCYHDKIDSLVVYDEDAATKNTYSEDNSPWSVINVFDGDAATNAVCEGYAKSFKYLSDLTHFNSTQINVYTVTGTMDGGAHMWNVVEMDDGKAYLVDPTLDDEGSIGYPHNLFLTGTEKGNYKNGYTIPLTTQSGWNTEVTYAYDDETLSLYNSEELTLNRKSYDPTAPKATVQPTTAPSIKPTEKPAPSPTTTPAPTAKPAQEPESKPSGKPADAPTPIPNATPVPTVKPTAVPAPNPASEPASEPAAEPAATPASVPAEEKTVTMYRAYNPNSGEHFYTSSTKEFDHIVSLGWRNEGTGWIAPENSNTPVYRLYNANGGEHHYTTSTKEKNSLIAAGWKDEGIGWYSDDSKRTPLYRQYNPNAFANNHNYTTQTHERDVLISLGWRDEGIGWYGARAE